MSTINKSRFIPLRLRNLPSIYSYLVMTALLVVVCVGVFTFITLHHKKLDNRPDQTSANTYHTSKPSSSASQTVQPSQKSSSVSKAVVTIVKPKTTTTNTNKSTTTNNNESGTPQSGGGGSGGNSGGGINLTAKNCEPHPSACGYPDASNTGIQPDVTLTQVPSQATSGAGWSYSGGIVTITGNVGSSSTGLQLAPGDEVVVPDGVNNITIDNVMVTGIHDSNDNAITIGTNTCQTDGCGPNNITVENCFLESQSYTPSGSMGGGVTISWQSKSISVKNCNISGAGGGIYYIGEEGTEITTGNYIHDPVAFNGSSHLNGITSGSGPDDTTSSWLVQDNTVLMTGTYGDQTTAAISLFPDGGPQLNDHATINENLLDTGNYYLIDNGYGDAYGSSGQSYIDITDNRLGASGNNAGAYYYTWYISPNTPGCHTGSGGVACTGDTDSGNFWDATLASAE